jgi:hypothetical protein
MRIFLAVSFLIIFKLSANAQIVYKVFPNNITNECPSCLWLSPMFTDDFVLNDESAAKVVIRGAKRYRYIPQFNLFQIETVPDNPKETLNEATALRDSITIHYEKQVLGISKSEYNEMERGPLLLKPNGQVEPIYHACVDFNEAHCSLPILRDTISNIYIYPEFIHTRILHGPSQCNGSSTGVIIPYIILQASLEDDQGGTYVMNREIITPGCVPENTIFYESSFRLLNIHTPPISFAVELDNGMFFEHQMVIPYLYLRLKNSLEWIQCK